MIIQSIFREISLFFRRKKRKVALTDQKEKYIYIDLLLTRDGTDDFNIYDEDIVRSDLSEYIIDHGEDSMILYQALYSFVYKHDGIQWVDMQVGVSDFEFERPKVMIRYNIDNSSGDVLTSNVGIININYKK